MRKNYIILIAFGVALLGFILSGIAYASVKPPLGETMLVGGVAMMTIGSITIALLLLMGLIKMLYK